MSIFYCRIQNIKVLLKLKLMTRLSKCNILGFFDPLGLSSKDYVSDKEVKKWRESEIKVNDSK